MVVGPLVALVNLVTISSVILLFIIGILALILMDAVFRE
jgi:hypothetical protein